MTGSPRCPTPSESISPSRRKTLFAFLKMLLAAPFAAARAIEAPSTRPAAVDLFAMGDWGEDTQAQRKVAEQMSRSARGLVNPLTGVVLCGDNFYFRLTGADDPRWQLLFEKMYDPAALGVPFYSCLGNHDCEANNQAIELEYARQNPRSRFKLPGLWYRRDLPVDRPLVTLIMLDSNKDALSELQWNQQISWLRDQLTGPRAAWTICCAHHPLFSNGFFFVNGILQRDWGALFEQHGVDFYLAGHEHNLQHLEIAGWKESFLIAGGGGAHAHPLFRADRGFSRQAFGFLHFAITPERAGVRFIDADGTVIHEFERTRAGQVKQILTTPNSIPERNALKTLLELRNRAPATRP